MKNFFSNHKTLTAFLIIIAIPIYLNREFCFDVLKIFGTMGKMAYEYFVPPTTFTYGLIDKQRNFIVKPKFDKIGVFKEGLAYACVNKKCGFINENGEFVIKPQIREFKYHSPEFKNGVAVVDGSQHPWASIINKKGEYLLKDVAYVDSMYQNNLIKFNLNGKNGYINTQGEIVIKPQFKMANEFKEGLAPVRNEDDIYYGFINEKGQMVIKPQFMYSYGFSEGLASVNIGSKWGFIDKTGKVVIKPTFDGGNWFNNGTAIAEQNGKKGFINKKGDYIVAQRFDDITYVRDTYPVVKVEDKYGYTDRTGAYIIKPKYEDAKGFREDLAPVKINKKWGFINKSDKFIIQPKFEDALPFSNGLAGVKLNGKWGFIDKTGKIVIAPQFDTVGFFNENSTCFVGFKHNVKK